MNRQHPDKHRGAPHLERPTAGSTRPPGPLRVAVLGHIGPETDRVRRSVAGLPEPEVVDPRTGEPDVLFCVAGSAWDMVGLLDPFGYPYPPTALLDLVLAIGPSVAALHGILGYLTPECPQSRWPDALHRASREHLYALAPDDAEFMEQWRAKPLTEVERRILRLSPLGLKKKALITRLGEGWNPTALYRAEQDLRQRLGLEEGEELAAAAVELGLHRFWPAPPPER